MPSAENAQWNVEAGQEFHESEVLEDSGDHKLFTSSARLWSSAKGKAAVVVVNGIRNGFVISPKASTNDAVTVTSGKVNLNGVANMDVAGGDLTALARPPGTAGVNFIKHAIVVDSSGTLAQVAGTGHTAFSTTRGAPGGPPLIAIDAVEIGQVWFTTSPPAFVLDSEIKQVPGTHQERADTPLYQQDSYEGTLTFVNALPLIHTGPTTKVTYVSFNTPEFLEIPNANNMQPPGITRSTNSTPVYKSAIGSVASALQAGSVTVLVDNGVNDFIIAAAEMGLLWHEFYPDANATLKHTGQAHVGVTTTYPADNNISTAVTLSPEKPWTRVE